MHVQFVLVVVVISGAQIYCAGENVPLQNRWNKLRWVVY